MTAKKATKKAAKKAAPKKVELLDTVLWVVSKRNGWFSWTPIQVFPTSELAYEYKNLYARVEGDNFYKVNRVDFINAPVEEVSYPDFT